MTILYKILLIVKTSDHKMLNSSSLYYWSMKIRQFSGTGGRMIGLEFTGERKKQPGVMSVGKGDCKFR